MPTNLIQTRQLVEQQVGYLADLKNHGGLSSGASAALELCIATHKLIWEDIDGYTSKIAISIPRPTPKGLLAPGTIRYHFGDNGDNSEQGHQSRFDLSG